MTSEVSQAPLIRSSCQENRSQIASAKISAADASGTHRDGIRAITSYRPHLLPLVPRGRVSPTGFSETLVDTKKI